jgi:hypothetical protein
MTETQAPEGTPGTAQWPTGERSQAVRGPEGEIHLYDEDEARWYELGEDRDGGWGSAHFEPAETRQQRMVRVEATACPKLDGAWTTNDQLKALAEAAFNLATTGANGGWVWLRQVHGQPPTEWVSEDSEEYPTPTEGELNADPTVVAWARFDCGDPETTVTL